MHAVALRLPLVRGLELGELAARVEAAVPYTNSEAGAQTRAVDRCGAMKRVASSHSIDDFGEDLDSFVTLSSFILTLSTTCPSLAAKGHIKKEEETDLCILLQSVEIGRASCRERV